MSKNLNISVLVSARDEYIHQLKCILIPLIIQGFNSIYEDAIRVTNNHNVIYKFQQLLKEIPKWNQTILQEESKRIKKKCTYTTARLYPRRVFSRNFYKINPLLSRNI